MNTQEEYAASILRTTATITAHVRQHAERTLREDARHTGTTEQQMAFMAALFEANENGLDIYSVAVLILQGVPALVFEDWAEEKAEMFCDLDPDDLAEFLQSFDDVIKEIWQ